LKNYLIHNTPEVVTPQLMPSMAMFLSADPVLLQALWSNLSVQTRQVLAMTSDSHQQLSFIHQLAVHTDAITFQYVWGSLMHRKFKVFTFTGQTHFTCG
jgi:hypothetical protein